MFGYPEFGAGRPVYTQPRRPQHGYGGYYVPNGGSYSQNPVDFYNHPQTRQQQHRLRRQQELEAAAASQKRQRNKHLLLQREREERERLRQEEQRARLLERYTHAATIIQRAWRRVLAMRRDRAAFVITRAVRSCPAIIAAKNVASSVQQLVELQRHISCLKTDFAHGAGVQSEKKRLLFFQDALEKAILATDNIPTYGDEFTRATRKQAVKAAQKTLQDIDNAIQQSLVESCSSPCSDPVSQTESSLPEVDPVTAETEEIVTGNQDDDDMTADLHVAPSQSPEQITSPAKSDETPIKDLTAGLEHVNHLLTSLPCATVMAEDDATWDAVRQQSNTLIDLLRIHRLLNNSAASDNSAKRKGKKTGAQKIGSRRVRRTSFQARR